VEVPVTGRPTADLSAVSLGRRTVDLTRRVLVMGIVNRTPDSFYDKGKTFALDRAVVAVQQKVRDGADWLDIGGVPFGPGDPVSAAEEIDRVLPVVEAARATGDVIISVDTTRAEVAAAAMAAGADVVNDTSGLRDPDMAAVVAETGAGIVITHSSAPARQALKRPHYDDVVATVREFLLERVDVALAAGIPVERIVIDPGHDLHKNTLHSLELTRRLDELAALGHPLLVAVSNKDFIGETLGVSLEQRLGGTVATATLCVAAGARILRVHDVATLRSAVTMIEAIYGWRPPATTRHNAS
jgi:dihydropteroate synthase